MSFIAALVRAVRASGFTSRNVWPWASKVDTPSEVRSLYSVVSGPTGSIFS